MPYETPIYGLDAFLEGEIYSSSLDQKRFLIIDSQFAFLADLIGYGVISGWNVAVSDPSTFLISVSPGIGLIDRFGTYTYGTEYVTINDNQTTYLYMKRRLNTIGGFSGFSDIAEITVVDTTPPAVPTGLAISPSYNSNTITWDANNEPDLDHYVLQRSTNNIDFSVLATVNTNLFTDSGLSQNTNYYYKVDAIDQSGNSSAFSGSVLGRTLKDLRQPAPVINVISFSRDTAIQLLWDAPPSSNVDHYTVYVQPLNIQFQPVGSPTIYNYSLGNTSPLITGLSNNVSYQIAIYAVNVNNVFSAPVYQILKPTFNNGPPEVDNIQITYEPDPTGGVPLIMTVCFSGTSDPYRVPADIYTITIYENDTGRVTQPITVVRGDFCRDILLLPYLNATTGQLAYESIQTTTSYTVLVQGISSTGVANKGSLVRTSTPTFVQPDPVTNFVITQREDFSLFATWFNSTSQYLSYNQLSLTALNTTTQVTTTLLNNANIGIASNYTISSSVAQPNILFTFVIYAVDIFGNVSEPVTSLYNVDVPSPTVAPPAPNDQIAISGDKQVTIQWTISDPTLVAYNIYRANFTFFPTATSFSQIDSVPGTVSSFVDYNVVNLQQYMYFVTSVNALGQETPTTTVGNFITYTFIYGTPTPSDTFTIPTNLIVMQSGFDALLSWDVSPGSFDGYEIWRSQGDQISFVLVGDVPPGDTTYTDSTVLLKADTPYYYMIRKFGNEADVFITESSADPQNSVLVAAITSVMGDITIDTSVANNLQNLEGPVTAATTTAIDAHHHNIDANGLDKRIDLSSDIVISPDQWTTYDYQTYTTTQSISGALAYGVDLEGTVNTAFFTDSQGNVNNGSIALLTNGIPPFLYTINGSLGQITFQFPLYNPAAAAAAAAAANANSVADAASAAAAASAQAANNLANAQASVASDDGSSDDSGDGGSSGGIGVGDSTSSSSPTPTPTPVPTPPTPNTPSSTASNSTGTQTSTSSVTGPPPTPAPFTDPPTLSLTLIGVNEVQNLLTSDRIDNFSATQVTTGTLNLEQLPEIGHDGRLGEPLVPVAYPMGSTDQFTWSYNDSTQTMGNGLTFYDVLQLEDDTLFAATSQGVLISLDFGNTWNVTIATPTAPNKLYFSPSLQMTFCLTSAGVYVTSGGFGGQTNVTWTLMTGTENTKVMRDIVEDSGGNIYVSTDLGVYILAAATVNQFFSWQQTTLFGAKSTESYALLYDSNLNRVLVSNELGILQTTTQGAVWNFTDEFNQSKKIFSFIQSNGSIFALCNDSIWRENGLTFVQIAQLTGTLARNMVIFQNRLFFTSDIGSLATDPLFDIYNDINIPIVPVLPELNVNGNVVPATSLDVIDNNLFIGTDQNLFVRKGNQVWVQNEDAQDDVPSIFVNGILQTVGVRYNPSSNNVSFDEVQDVSAVVAGSNHYGAYTAEFGGWAFQEYDCEVIFYVNGQVVADTNNMTTPITLDGTQFTNFQFPTFDETNSYSAGATNYENIAQNLINNLGEILGITTPPTGQAAATLAPGQTLPNLVSEIMVSLAQFMSQLFPSALVIQVTDVNGNTTTVGLELPAINVQMTPNISYNVTNGLFTFTSPYNKYDNLTVDIKKVTVKNVGDLTHKEVEDGLELVNSGLPSSLSQVQQANIVKVGLFNQRTWPNEQAEYATPYQATYNVPFDNSWYDVLNSTVDWSVQIDKSVINPSLQYAATAIYIPTTDQVLVGGPNGALLIDAETIDIQFVTIDSGPITVKQFFLYQGTTIYAVTDTALYQSIDYAQTWQKLSRIGLPSRLYSMLVINSTLVVGGIDGIYFQISELTGWSKALTSKTPVEIMFAPDLAFAVIDGAVYFSTNGFNWTQSGDVQTVDINSLAKFRSLIFVGTEEGLYTDNGTFYGAGANLSLVNTIGTTGDSQIINVNDVSADNNSLIAGIGDGTIVYLDGAGWTTVENIPLQTIHKVLCTPTQVWLFGYDLFVVAGGNPTSSTPTGGGSFNQTDWLNMGPDAALTPKSTYPFRLSSGAPL